MRLRQLTAVLILAAAGAARAQDISPLEPPDTARYLRWGPFRVRPGLTIPTFGYDNNVFYTPDNSTTPPVGDYFLDISPRVEGMVLLGSRAFITFDERLEFYVYATQHEVDYFNQFGRARITIPVGNYGFFVDTGYTRVRDRPVDAQDVRPIRRELPLGAGLIFKFGWRSDAEFGYSRTRYTAEDPDDPCVAGTGCFTIDQRIDRLEDGFDLRARYLVFGRTRLTLEASERDIVFDEPLVQRDGQERRVVPGLDFGLGGRMFGTLRVGYARFNLDKATATDFSGFVADTALGYRLGGQGSFVTLRAQRDVRYSVLESTDLYTYTAAELGLIRYFNRFIGMELSVGRGRLDFLGDPSGRVDTIDTGVAGVRFRFSETQLGRRVEYAFRYVLTRRDSTLAFLDQTRGTVGFGVVLGY